MAAPGARPWPEVRDAASAARWAPVTGVAVVVLSVVADAKGMGAAVVVRAASLRAAFVGIARILRLLVILGVASPTCLVAPGGRGRDKDAVVLCDGQRERVRARRRPASGSRHRRPGRDRPAPRSAGASSCRVSIALPDFPILRPAGAARPMAARAAPRPSPPSLARGTYL